jgi:hypothetical protein
MIYSSRRLSVWLEASSALMISRFRTIVRRRIEHESYA